MTIEKMQEILAKHPSNFTAVLKKHHSDFYNKINNLSDDGLFSQKLYDYFYGKSKCAVCGNDVKFLSIHKGYSNTCGYKCNAKQKHINANEIRNCVICNSPFKIYKKRKKTTCSQTCLNALNSSPNVVQKRLMTMKTTLQSIYGVDHYSKTDSFRKKMQQNHLSGVYDYQSITKKIKQTKYVRYGDSNYNNLSKVKQSLLNNYGVDNFSKTEDFKKAHYERVINRLPSNIKFLGNFDEYNGVTQCKYNFKCLDCNEIFSSSIDNGIIPICKKCNPNKWGTSTFQEDLVDYLRSIYDDTILLNDRTVISPKEIDIVLPKLGIAIECNGNYWHSEISGGKDKGYHFNKTKECQNVGLRLIHIFEDEWLYKNEIVKSRIRHLLNKTHNRLYARNLIVNEISSADANAFLDKTHIQGSTKSSVNLGIFNNDVLVGVMSFSRRKIFKNDAWELSRFSTSCSIVGGASKLFNYFVKKNKPNRVVSYSDIRWNTGVVYEKIGFTKVSQTPPSYWYLKNGQRINRINFQKHKLEAKLEVFNPSLTEWENMQINKYDRIWDCGNYKYEWVCG